MNAVCVRPGADPHPLFIVHEAASELGYVHELAPHVDGGLPIYGVCPTWSDAASPTTVEGMATRMTRVIREIQPAGPYRLAGVSVAGLLAYEIGAQLVGDDQQVEFLGLIGTARHDDALSAPASRSALAAAATRYDPLPTTVPVHLFVNGRVAADGDLGWSTTVPEGVVRVIAVPSATAASAGADSSRLGPAISSAIRSASGGEKTSPGTYAPLFALQSRSHRAAALCCVPGAGADVTSFISLVSCLGEALLVYGLQPRGLDGVLVPHTTVAAAALTYVQALAEADAKGPVRLLGHSFGGWVAFEMACLLREAGRCVAAVTLLDTECPDATEDVPREYTSVDCLHQWIEGVEQQLGRPLGIARADLERCTAAQQRELMHRHLVTHGVLPRQSSPSVLGGRLRVFSAALRTRYRPQRQYAGPVTLVVADDPHLDTRGNRQRMVDAADGWRRWAPDIRCIKAPGNHMTMLSAPHVEFLADVIRQDLS